MTEELPDDPVEVYQFPGKYFERLREWKDVHNGRYSVVQGALYRALADPDEPHFTEKDAMQVSRLLNRGEIDKAENLVYDVLEEGEEP